jgi:O-glycosyl hydrolase
VYLTVNGKSFATKGQCNIDSSHYNGFAQYAVYAIQQVKRSTGITFNYISPVNEPQWDWSDGGQEGCPYNNTQISAVVKNCHAEILKNKMPSKLLITESGHHKYLFDGSDKPENDDQITDFFKTSSVNYVGDWPGIVRAIASHSYFTTSPGKEAMALRNRIRDSIARIKNLEYWQSEYCILGDNAGELSGSKRDTGMRSALYVAKVMYYDLVGANASAWHWWLAISPYNYKDGLIYIDKNKTDGNYYDSKMLWAVGNYSRFVRPGMQRIDVQANSQQVYVSAFKDAKKVVMIFVNPSTEQRSIKLNERNKTLITYTTNKTDNLKKRSVLSDQLLLPAESVVTVIANNGK